MAKTKSEYQYIDLSPFQEIKIIFLNLGYALKIVKWKKVLLADLLAYLTLFIVLASAYRLLDHSWLLPKAAMKAALGALFIGFMLVFQVIAPRLLTQVETERQKLKKSLEKNSSEESM